MKEKGLEERGPKKTHSKNSDLVVPLWFRYSLVAFQTPADWEVLRRQTWRTKNIFASAGSIPARREKKYDKPFLTLLEQGSQSCSCQKAVRYSWRVYSLLLCGGKIALSGPSCSPGVAAILSETVLDQNGPNDHFGRNDLIPNRILAFARPKWTLLVHFGPFWPGEAHFGPFRSANRTPAIPECSPFVNTTKGLKQTITEKQYGF